MYIWKTRPKLCCLLATVSTFCFLPPIASAETLPAMKDDKESLSRALKHQEDLVRSMECVLHLRGHPTNRDMIPFIKDYLQIHNRLNEFSSFIASGDNEPSVYKCLVKKCPGFYKFRLEQYKQSNQKSDIWTFDGQIERSLDENVNRGSIWHGKSHGLVRGWNAPASPFAIIHHYGGTPYSEIVKRGDNFRMAVMQKDERKKKFIHVSVNDPTDKSIAFHLLFDEYNRLVERDIIDDRWGEKKSSIHEKHLISNYKPYHDSSGEIIWFPDNVIFSYIVGTLTDGKMAEFRQTSLEIKEVVFNPEIPEEKFSIDFPPNAEIFDGLNHQGWIGQDQLSSSTTPKVSTQRSSRLWLLIVDAVVLALLVIFLFWRLWRRLRSA